MVSAVLLRTVACRPRGAGDRTGRIELRGTTHELRSPTISVIVTTGARVRRRTSEVSRVHPVNRVMGTVGHRTGRRDPSRVMDPTRQATATARQAQPTRAETSARRGCGCRHRRRVVATQQQPAPSGRSARLTTKRSGKLRNAPAHNRRTYRLRAHHDDVASYSVGTMDVPRRTICQGSTAYRARAGSRVGAVGTRRFRRRS